MTPRKLAPSARPAVVERERKIRRGDVFIAFMKSAGVGCGGGGAVLGCSCCCGEEDDGVDGVIVLGVVLTPSLQPSSSLPSSLEDMNLDVDVDPPMVSSILVFIRCCCIESNEISLFFVLIVVVGRTKARCS